MRRMLIASLAVLALIVAGCGGDDEEATTTATAQTETTTAASGDQGGGSGDRKPAGGAKTAKQGTTIKLASSPVGDALFDGDDQAIYLFDIEKTSRPECYDDCAEAWPPVLTEGDPIAQGPIDQELLGTTKRDDGSTQVTYNDHPLYFYAHEAPGELRCHNVPGFGGLWLALDETGDPLS